MTRQETLPTPGLAELKADIARLWSHREALKRDLETGEVGAHPGLRRLVELDRALSDLDSRFKAQWDAGDRKAAA